MGQHDALGKAGCAGGIDEGGNAIRDLSVDGFGLNLWVQRTKHDLTQARQVVDGSSMPFGVFPGLRRNAGGVKDATSAAVLPDRIDFARRQTGIDEHGPCVQGRHGEKRRHEWAAVLAHHHDPIPRPYAGVEQPGSGCGDSRGQFSIGTMATRVHQRQLIWGRFRPPGEDVADAFREIAQEFGNVIVGLVR